MFASTVALAVLALARAVSGAPTAAVTGASGNDAPLQARAELGQPSHDLLKWSKTDYTPAAMPAFQAKIDWDLDNNHTIQTPTGLRASWWSREGYWYDSDGNMFGEILRANDDGVVTAGTKPGTRYLELLITYVVLLDDGFWAYVTHTGGAIVREYQNGVVRVETESEKYSWLNRIDFVAPGSFNGTEVMTVNHYFPNAYNLPNGLPTGKSAGGKDE